MIIVNVFMVDTQMCQRLEGDKPVFVFIKVIYLNGATILCYSTWDINAGIHSDLECQYSIMSLFASNVEHVFVKLRQVCPHFVNLVDTFIESLIQYRLVHDIDLKG